MHLPRDLAVAVYPVVFGAEDADVMPGRQLAAEA